MKALALVMVALQLPLLHCGAGTRKCEHCVKMHGIGRNEVASPIIIGGRPEKPFVFVIGEKRVETIEQFQTVIAALPRGTEVVWDSGCIKWSGLPIAGGPFPISGLETMCANHGIKFTYIVSGYWHNSSNQPLQPTATRCASSFLMTKTVLEIFSHAPGSRA